MQKTRFALFSFFLVLAITVPGWAASGYLKYEFHGVEDTTQIKQFLNQGELYLNTNKDSTLRYFNLANIYSQQLYELYTDSSETNPRMHLLAKYLFATSLYKNGIAYRVYGNYSQAIRMMLESQQLLDDFRFSETNEFTRISLAELASCYLNLGLIFEVLESPKVAEEKVALAEKYVQNIEDKDVLALFYLEIAGFYLNRATDRSADTNVGFWTMKSDSMIVLAEKFMHNRMNVIVNLRLWLSNSQQALLKKNYKEAIQMVTKAEPLLVNLNNNYWAALSHSMISETYLNASYHDPYNRKKYLLNSIRNAEKGLEQLKPIGGIQIEKKLNNILRNTWAEMGDMKRYQYYAEVYIKNRDSMVSELKKGTLAALEQEYLLVKEEQKTTQLLIQRDSLFKKIQNDRLFILLGFIVFAFTVLILILINKSQKKQKRLLLLIAENEKHLQSLVQTIPGTIYRCLPDKDYTMVFLSDEVVNLTGFEKQSFLIKETPFSNLIHPEDREEVARLVNEAIQERMPYVLEYRIIRNNGEVVFVFDKGIAEYDEHGKPIMLNGTILDITKLKNAEIELKAALERIMKLTSVAPVSIITWDHETHITEWNAHAEKTFGWKRDEVIGRSFLDINVIDRSKFDVKQIWEQVLDGSLIQHTEHENITKDGRIIFCEWNNAIIYDKNGQPVSVLSMAADITKKIEAEKQFKEIYINSDRALDLTKSGFWQIKMNDFRHFVASDRVRDIFGLVRKSENDVPELAEVLMQIKVLNPEMADLIAFKLERILKGELGHFEVEHEYLHPQSGEELWIKSKAYVDKDENGNPVSLYGVSQDITITKRLQKDLETAREAAEAATKAKSDFLANMSHEIRTPMNAIIGMTHLVQKTQLDDKQLDYVSKISRSANALLGIINDILDFSKIEAGKLNIENIDFELQEVLDGVTDLVLQKAHQKNLEFLIRIDPAVPSFLVGDPLRLGQVITNLCSNAVKFTEEGEIVVDVSVDSTTETSINLKVEVKDSGIGLTAEQQQKLFQAFSQADTSTTRKYGGTGLGLTISQNLVKLMKGYIAVDSEPGKGSNFHFTIACGISKKEKRDVYQAPIDIRGMKVMVCDDNETAREILAEALRVFTFEVTVTSGAKEAIKLLQQASDKAYELLLLDFKMPEINGLEALSLISNDPLIAHKPKVIMVSAYGKEMLEGKNDQPLIEGFIDKPLNYSTLFNSIMNVFGQHARRVSKLEESNDELIQKLKEQSGNVILLVEDNEINQQVAKEIIEETGLVVEIAGNGEIAVEMVRHSGNPSKYRLVLMDLQMPVMDGITATLEIRKMHDYITLPILAMTADAMAGVKEKVLEAGMMDMLTKPIDPNDVYRKILKWMVRAGGMKLQNKEVFNRETEQPDRLIPQIEGLETEVALQRLNGNKKLYLSILEKYYQNNLHFIQDVSVLISAVDSETLKRQFHTLKGLSGSIGASDIQQLTQELEQFVESDQIEKLQTRLPSLDEKMKALLEEIHAKIIDRKQSSVNELSAQLGPLIDELEDLIKKKSPQAKKLLPALEQAGLNDPSFQKLKRALTTYNFKEAEIQLVEIKRKNLSI